MSKFSLARAVGTAAEGIADAAAAEDEVGEITFEPKGALEKSLSRMRLLVRARPKSQVIKGTLIIYAYPRVAINS